MLGYFSLLNLWSAPTPIDCMQPGGRVHLIGLAVMLATCSWFEVGARSTLPNFG
jgi:hypothetical protein